VMDNSALYVRHPWVIVEFDGEAIVASRLDTRTRVYVSRSQQRGLEQAWRPVSPQSLDRTLGDRKEVEKLVRLGLIVDATQADVPQAWAVWGVGAVALHFGSRDVGHKTLADLPDKDTSAFSTAKARDYSHLKEFVELPAPSDLSGEFAGALEGRRSVRNYIPEFELPLADLGGVLWSGLGTRNVAEARYGFTRGPAPSGGGLRPIEAWVIARNVNGLVPGVYQYDRESHRLAWTRSVNFVDDEIVGVLPAQPELWEASAIIVLTATWDRVAAKYKSSRAYRNILIESGCIAQILAMSTVVSGLSSLVFGAFEDTPMNTLLGIDPHDEDAILAIAVGKADS
jgi:SagB-type dehydrogenase family enzyme